MPDHARWSNYLDVQQSDSRLGAFLQIVDGDEVIAETTGFQTLTARVDNCGNTITVRYGIQDSEGAGGGGTLTYPLDYVDQAAAEADGWTVGSGVQFNVPLTLGPYSTVTRFHTTGGTKLTQTLTGLTPGSQYRTRIWGTSSAPSFSRAEIIMESTGFSTRKHSIVGTKPPQEFVATQFQTVGVDGNLTLRLTGGWAGSSQFWVAGLVVEPVTSSGAGGAAFRDVRYVFRSGLGDAAA